MRESLEDVAKALVAHPKFQWAARMHTLCGWTVISSNTNGILIEAAIVGSGEVALFIEGRPVRYALESEHVKNWIPDLADPGTGGCLWTLLLRHSLPGNVLASQESDTRICIETCLSGQDVAFYGDTLGEACAKALLALWETASAS